jgi:hypothetical protein
LGLTNNESGTPRVKCVHKVPKSKEIIFGVHAARATDLWFGTSALSVPVSTLIMSKQ